MFRCYENNYAAGLAEGISQGLSSGKVKLTAHFHDTGDIEFISDDTQTAYQKYQTYLASHNVGETSSTQYGCFSTYHGASRCDVWLEVTSYTNYGCNYTDERAQTAHTHYRVTERHSDCGKYLTWEQCSVASGDISSHGFSHTYGSPYYSPDCGHTNGEILSVEIFF